MISVGRGVAAGFQITVQDGQLMVVAGSLWEQIERERRDGPRWSLALREGRRLRERAAATGRYGWPTDNPGTWAEEWRGGIPVGWWNRP